MFKAISKEVVERIGARKEWSEFERRGVIDYINEIFREELDIEKASIHFGFSYHSHNAPAILAANNNSFFGLEGLLLHYFILLNSGVLVGVFWDDEENEYYYTLED